ncbi:hypothetical protein SDC9_143172 [bioreactor metagenome]|uniref:Uncharacterized protein n=1 Tax=bioreactor metagenome TaxID=1076179 RepID=A0A645E365_9ZZZZ
MQFPVPIIGLQPDTALTALNNVLGGFVLLVERRQLVSLLNNVSVLVHPVIIDAEFVNNLLFYFVDSHYMLTYFSK